MYTPLYIKTNNNILSSIIKIDELVKFALDNNLKSLTITDSNMYGAYDFYKECTKNNIKPIIGLEVSIPDKIVLYAKNYEGYKNLIKLSTIQSERMIKPNDLLKYNNDLICILTTESNKYYQKIKKIYNDDLYMSYNLPSIRKTIKEKCVFMNETLYIEKNDIEYLKYLYAIRDGKKINEIELTGNNYVILESMLSKLPTQDLENNKIITECCNLEFPEGKVYLPKFDCPDNMDSFTYLKKLCKEGLIKKFGTRVPKAYIDRLKIELNTINDMGFCDYFLVVSDFIKYAKNNNIYIGPGRGSAAGSLVAYLIDIITIDPLKYNLLFERFLNPERVTLPDIDVDIEDSKRQEVINYCIEKYGEKRVVPIIGFGTFKAKQAIRDVGRVMDINVEYISSLIDSSKTLEKNLENEKLRDHINMDDNLKKLYEVSKKLEDLKRTITLHASGVIISDTDIDTVIPLDKSHGDYYTTAFNHTYLEEIGLIKMDFLSLSNLGNIHSLVDDIGIDIDVFNIPENDKNALKVFNDADMLGIFQFENQGMVNFLRKFKITSFNEVVDAIALYRPGPMQFIDSYIKRRNNQELVDYIDDSLISILKPTYGIIIYQEQIMQVAQVMAGYSLGEADILRRAMSKKKEDIIIKQKEIFINRCTLKGHSLDVATRVYEMILKFASYGFNKSHSVAYAKVAYLEAYLKGNYRIYFMKNHLNNYIGSSDGIKKYVSDCKKHNIKILNPNINESKNEFIIKDNCLLYPLMGIKGVGREAVNEIINKAPFTDIYDFFKKCYSKIVNKNTIECLVNAGCFDILNINRRTILENIEELINYAEISHNLDFDIYPELKQFNEFSNKELLIKESNQIGFYLNNHPVKQYYNNIFKKITNMKKDANVKTVLLIDRINIINTKKGDKMAFLTGSNEDMEFELVMFPNVLKNNSDINKNDICYIDARIDYRDSNYQFIINNIKKIN